jgi:hypothetical protein
MPYWPSMWRIDKFGPAQKHAFLVSIQNLTEKS